MVKFCFFVFFFSLSPVFWINIKIQGGRTGQVIFIKFAGFRRTFFISLSSQPRFTSFQFTWSIFIWKFFIENGKEFIAKIVLCFRHIKGCQNCSHSIPNSLSTQSFNLKFLDKVFATASLIRMVGSKNRKVVWYVCQQFTRYALFITIVSNNIVY